MAVLQVRTKKSGLRRALRRSDGSSLLEVALMLPMVVLILAFTIDAGYFFLVATNLVTASRNAVLYSTQGYSAPGQGEIPLAGMSGSLADTSGVAGVAGGDLSGLTGVGGAGNKAKIQVCSKSIGVSQVGSTYVTNCNMFPGGSVQYSPDVDPESAYGQLLQRVDVVYTISPPITLNFFAFTMPPLNFHWQVEMRAID